LKKRVNKKKKPRRVRSVSAGGKSSTGGVSGEKRKNLGANSVTQQQPWEGTALAGAREERGKRT